MVDFPHADVPGAVREVCARLEEHGYRAWVVGGCIRDLLLRRPVGDWDLATSARPHEVQRVFRRVIPTGIAHGTVTVLHRDASFEVTTLRGDGAYSDGRRPDAVTFVNDIGEDLARRDFTVNALAYEPSAGAIIDPYGGIGDLQAGIIRAVGDPAERFAEDGLRILRGARFVASLEFDLAPDTEAAFAGALPVFAKVSPERVREEWLKAVRAPEPSRAFWAMRRTGILDVCCAPLAELPEKPFALSVAALDASTARDSERLAALLHRVEGDPTAAGDHVSGPGGVAEASAGRAQAWLRDYRFSNRERQTIVHAIAMHRAVLTLDAADGPATRRLAHRVGRDAADSVLRLAVAVASAEQRPVLPAVEALRSAFASELPLSVGDLAIGGREVIAELGGGRGRVVGDVLQGLLQRVLENPDLNESSQLRALVSQVAAQRSA